ncbi:MAG TPA: sigma-70 family RNA polymerase sigma factor [Gemmataceae bacterium]|jgi:RNA polymerase sigma factor (sigma-70 family)|nr:sigma-70 family RNA polymerase sigma factor [Gemmataceae bacterium]
MPNQPLDALCQHIRKLAAVQAYNQFADWELLDRFIRTKDETAFAVLFRRHGPMVLGVCNRALHDIHRAEDACQAAFLVLAQRAPGIRKSASLASWLHGVAQHVAANARRTHSRQLLRERRDPNRASSEPEAEVTWREAQVILDEEIQRLPATLQAPIILCYFDGRTRDQAAKELNITVATLHGRLERGRGLLRDRLTRRGLTLPAALLVASLGAGATQAALPPVLVLSTTTAAVLLATRAGLGDGLVSSNVLALSQEVLRIMASQSFRRVLMIAVTGALLMTTAGLGYYTYLRPAVPDEIQASAPPPQPLPGQPRWQERLRLQGDAGGGFGGFSPDGKTLTTVSSKDILFILDTTSWRERGRYDLGARYGTHYISNTLFSPDGRHIAVIGGVPKEAGSAERRPETTVLETAGGKELYRLPGRTPSFSPAGKLLATVSKDTVLIWDLLTGKELHRLAAGAEIPAYQAEPVKFSPDGRYLFASTKTGQGKLWDVARSKEIAALSGFLPVWSPDSRALVTTSPGPVLHLWDAETGAARATLQDFSQPGCSGEFSSDGRMLLTSVFEFGIKADGTNTSMDPNTPRKPYKPKKIAIDIRLWETATGKELQRLPGSTQFCRSATFSPDGRTILYPRLADGPGYKMEAVLWDVAAGKERCVVREPQGVEMLQFTPDGSALVGLAGSRSQGTIRFWNAANGQPLPGLQSSLTSDPFGYHFSPDGKILAIPLMLLGGEIGAPVPREMRIFQWSAKELAKEARGDAPPPPVAQAEPAKSPTAQAFEAIEQKSRSAETSFAQQYAAATEAARIDLAQERIAALAGFVALARNLARANPLDPKAGDALEFALRLTAGSADGPLGEQSTQTLALIQQEYLNKPIMDRLVPWLAHNPTPEAEALLQKVMETHPLRQVRGRAGYWLASGLQEKAEAALLLRQTPALLNHPEVKQKPTAIRLLQSTDPLATTQRAEAIYERLRKDYADVKLYDFQAGDLGPAADQALFALRNLAVGKTAPEIEGSDLDGHKFKLSEYRGKVVVLIFCGHWCGPCRQMEPAKQELVKRHAGKPFALLEVNSDDDPDEWKAIMKQSGYTWRCWADGGKTGPIAQHWNVTKWPTIFLLDEHGVIRSKDLRDEFLDQAVAELLGKVGQGADR